MINNFSDKIYNKLKKNINLNPILKKNIVLILF